MRSLKSYDDLKMRARSFLYTDPIDGSRSRSLTLKGDPDWVCPESCNFRDIGKSAPQLKTGMVYRSSQVVRYVLLQVMPVERFSYSKP